MFHYDNGVINIAAFPRCGHTALRKFFGENHAIMDQGPDWLFKPWFEGSKRRVCVIRHPIQRMWSAVRTPRDEFDCVSSFDKVNSETDEWFIAGHCTPYLHRIRFCDDFKWIEFDKLSEYIGDNREGSPVTNSFETTYDEFPLKYGYIHSVTEQRIKNEVEFYNDIKQTREELSIEEWKELVNEKA